MNLEHRTQDGVDIVKLPEQLMMADAADARATIKDIISSGSGKLVLDLADTTFMDSSGLAVLVSSLQAARSPSQLDPRHPAPIRKGKTLPQAGGFLWPSSDNLSSTVVA